MTLEKIFSIILLLELEIEHLRIVYFQYKAGMKTEDQLRIAYNTFRSRLSIIYGED